MLFQSKPKSLGFHPNSSEHFAGEPRSPQRLPLGHGQSSSCCAHVSHAAEKTVPCCWKLRTVLASLFGDIWKWIRSPINLQQSPETMCFFGRGWNYIWLGSCEWGMRWFPVSNIHMLIHHLIFCCGCWKNMLIAAHAQYGLLAWLERHRFLVFLVADFSLHYSF